MRISTIFACVSYIGVGLVAAQSRTEPCASVSALWASFAAASPRSTNPLILPADLAYNCSKSAPIIQQDALSLIDGYDAVLQWQSDLAWLKNPPSGYLLASTDLLGGLANIRNNVVQNKYPDEISFETDLVNLITSAHDGHLAMLPDAYGVFAYSNLIGDLVSLSIDGISLPQVYSYTDLVLLATGRAVFTPSAIVTINGQNATTYLTRLALNGTVLSQDPDAMYNQLFYQPTRDGGIFSGSSFNTYAGTVMTFGFQNGTTRSFPNYAYTYANFQGVNNGQTFYYSFCNATVKFASYSSKRDLSVRDIPTPASPHVRKRDPGAFKAPSPEYVESEIDKRQSVPSSTLASSSSAKSVVPGPTGTGRPNYPSPVAISSDASLAGYFLTGAGYENTAVLSITEMTMTSWLSVQQTLKTFLAACRAQNKNRLVIDLLNNGGGSILLAYELSKQLFPTLDPYAAAQFRAHPQYDIMGQVITPLAQRAIRENGNNVANASNFGAYSIWDATTYNNASGQAFNGWSDYYGPVTVHGDNFTNLIRYDVNDILFDIENTQAGYVVSGYGNNTQLAPQPFQPQNMVLLTEGYCASTCTTFAHIMKWQGKVKSVALGGRPQTGPMQYIGGVKGKQVYNSYTLGIFGQALLQGKLGATKAQIQTANSTKLSNLVAYGKYLILRTANPSDPSEAVTVNIQNSITEADSSYTPLQFVYEAADCRIFWTPQMMLDFNAIWKTTANAAFGVNGTKGYDPSLCVAGSTGAASSLSGNTTLYNNGQITNVTIFTPEVLPSGTTNNSPSTTNSNTSSSPTKGAAARLSMEGAGLTGLVAIMAACVGAMLL